MEIYRNSCAQVKLRWLHGSELVIYHLICPISASNRGGRISYLRQHLTNVDLGVSWGQDRCLMAAKRALLARDAKKMSGVYKTRTQNMCVLSF